ncbi:MAG: carboxylating nicotinate-nucleotide diphosphorylase [Methylohalobius sp.]|nr:carboxylating nicotinate-nucleotide diphosphorylase [Methylohalobius sp.]
MKVSRDEVRRFLAEDVGTGDITVGIIPEFLIAEAEVICREPMVLCGRAWFEAVFLELDPHCRFVWQVEEGEEAPAGACLCRLQGSARSLLTGERTALNLLQTLSGTATLARRFAQAVAGTQAVILDTRKTLPGLRRLQKYAVRVGGCQNHRFGLFDGILIKENHILAAGSIRAAIAKAKALNTGFSIEVEVESLQELEEALAAGADIVLLDNFSLEELRQAVALTRQMMQHKVFLEASGNIDLDNVRQVAETGVDRISIGALTKHLKAVDLSLRLGRVKG